MSTPVIPPSDPRCALFWGNPSIPAGTTAVLTRRLGVRTLGDIASYTRQELIAAGLGPDVQHIVTYLGRYGLLLRPDRPQRNALPPNELVAAMIA